MEKSNKHTMLIAGIDIGSTTTKIVAYPENNKNEVYTEYRRHQADQLGSVRRILKKMSKKYPGAEVRLTFTGSGARPVSQMLDMPFVQEVVANSIALKKQYPNVRTAIELGGQDAKIIFFNEKSKDKDPGISDMRMNGSCAGGTGAFIDEMASVLSVPVDEFDALAREGTHVYDISGRCGVYAKTDIQPLLNQGVPKADLALSSFHAIAKQTIGGLAQGMTIESPVAFEGGPFTFQPTLVRVFAEHLNLSQDDILLPEHPELPIAQGAAIYSETSDCHISIGELIEKLETMSHAQTESASTDRRFFHSVKERQEFIERHRSNAGLIPGISACSSKTLRVYLGIDAGSTTTKFVFMDEDENIVDSFYAPNEGEPLLVAKNALVSMNERYKKQGIKLDVIAAGTTGYGELLFSKAFDTECHVVETVAHARAVEKYVKDATFILDIGGQDMKAIWLDNGVITNIVVNEACSSGCGSFLENFASSLHIPVENIADAAFASKHPAELGSRCTVFMNSSIITEQRNGKSPDDIMAGLCRSIIENVFTKVIRVSNLDSLGDKIVVQGGTFQNDAVLCAMEQYIGREVTRAPYPGIMGAIGAALITKERFSEQHLEQSFTGLDNIAGFSYTQESDARCPFCMNHCSRTIVSFSNGKHWITNNRCEKGEILGDPKSDDVKRELKKKTEDKEKVKNLFELREKLLFADYPYTELAPKRNIRMGLPRVLSYWETMPFWKTFLSSLGFDVVISSASSRKLYESGLSAVTSDTICFPAKLVHGHLRDLAAKKVDRIFMPSITVVPSENTEDTSQSMCAVVKGYPMVIKNSDSPQKQWDIPFDAPLFHWYTDADRNMQLSAYMKEQFDISPEITKKAISYGDDAMDEFHKKLCKAGDEVCSQVKASGKYAVVLASRPYQNDNLVNHGLAEMFTSQGIPVLTADSIKATTDLDLSHSRIDIVNNYHARMISSAIFAAQHDFLEYVQIVSFGCGHDAYLSDEIIRIMKEISQKTPLVLKLDESDVKGPLRIRVRSFLETVDMRRKVNGEPEVHELTDAYPVKFQKEDRKQKVVLIPNTSHAFCRIMSAAFAAQGISAEPLDIGREEAIALGKRYVHNDICFPAQIVIGEALAALESGKYDDKDVAIGMGKYVGDCRLTHYGALLRKALDDAGYKNVPIITNDDEDRHNLHPGFKMNVVTALRIAFALPMIDALEELLRKIRPYETVPGSADTAFEKGMDKLVYGLEHRGINGAKQGFSAAIDIMNSVQYDRSRQKPRVLIVGEYLLNFHPGANHEIEAYLEENGFEIIEARMTDVIRKTYFYQDTQVKEYHVHRPFMKKAWYHVANSVFEQAHDMTDSIAKKHPLYERACRMPELVKDSDEILHHTFDAGEGVLIPGEIIHHAKHGCRNFIILQPFGCLPNHVVGRGIVKSLKEKYPDAAILTLDYDPDVSFANVENRLQMMITEEKLKSGQK